MDPTDPTQLGALAAAGIVAGLGLLIRGFAGYRTAARISDIATSELAAIAVGEVRVSGVVEPAEVTLVSALQSKPCVYYRASIRERTDRDADGSRSVLSEERAVGFRLSDGSAAVRVFPRGARWDVPDRFAERSSLLEGEPIGLHPRTGALYAVASPDREAQVAALLGSARPFEPGAASPLWRGAGGDRTYAEARIEPGDAITIVGRALPFASLDEPEEANVAVGPPLAPDDPEVAASIATARAEGRLLDDPRAAWGNAAIPGFGIGRPVSEPSLDPAADRPTLATADEAGRAAQTFEIAPEQLVIAAGPDAPLLIALGGPDSAAARQQARFVVGLLGATLAIGSATVLAIAIGGSLGT